MVLYLFELIMTLVRDTYGFNLAMVDICLEKTTTTVKKIDKELLDSYEMKKKSRWYIGKKGNCLSQALIPGGL